MLLFAVKFTFFSFGMSKMGRKQKNISSSSTEKSDQTSAKKKQICVALPVF